MIEHRQDTLPKLHLSGLEWLPLPRLVWSLVCHAGLRQRGTVVATDTASANADQENGAAFSH